jgi:malonyl-CoA O-methyltransferase
MARAAAARLGGRGGVLLADAERLPLASHSVDLVFANLVLPWCRPDRVFAEAARVLSDGGVLLFATVGPDSLAEIRRAFAGVDRGIHVHAAFDMHDLGDLAMRAGLVEPVLDVDRLTVTYAEPAAVWRDLRSVAAVNVAGGRRRALTGRGAWSRVEAALAPRTGERFAITVELIFGQAFGRGPGARQRPAPTQSEVAVPIDRIRRRTEST